MDDLGLIQKKAGYQAGSVLNRGFNLVLALFFIVLASPVMLVVAGLVRVMIGRPILYSGVRYGLHKKEFYMFKFRTLPQGFEKQNTSSLVSYVHRQKLPWFSRFLRDTRLDELPQLFNIVKGDMEFIGPRPIRPSVYRALCQKIKNYDRRFGVSPGLVGYSQLFTPHSTPKRIRSFIDNKASRMPKRALVELYILFLAVFAVVSICFRLGLRKALSLFKTYNEKRGLDRIKQDAGRVFIIEDMDFIAGSSGAGGPVCRLVDINEEYFRMDCHAPIQLDKSRFFLSTRIKLNLNRKVTKSAYCQGKVYLRYENLSATHKYTYVIRYTPISELNQYFVDQYFLRSGMMRYIF